MLLCMRGASWWLPWWLQGWRLYVILTVYFSPGVDWGSISASTGSVPRMVSRMSLLGLKSWLFRWWLRYPISFPLIVLKYFYNFSNIQISNLFITFIPKSNLSYYFRIFWILDAFLTSEFWTSLELLLTSVS